MDQKGKEVGRTEQTERCNFVMKDMELALKGDGKGDEDGSASSDPETKDEDGENGKDTGSDEEVGDNKASSAEGVVEHRRTYDYNEKGLDGSDQEYQAFLDRVEKLIKEGASVTISVLGSASRVPTSSFPSNNALAKQRVEDAQADLKKDLKDRGVSLSSLEFRSENKVQGPPYESGNIRSKEEYMEHQYVRIKVLQ